MNMWELEELYSFICIYKIAIVYFFGQFRFLTDLEAGTSVKNLELCDCHAGIDCLGETRKQDPTVARVITRDSAFLSGP